MVKTNNKNYVHYKSRHDDIKKVLLQGGTWSINSIRKELLSNKVEISLQGIEKHLKNMVEKREVAYLDNNKTNQKFIKDIFPSTKMNSKIRRYFIGTPLSGKLFVKLTKMTKTTVNPDKYRELINEITDIYRALEIMSPYQKHEFTEEDAIRKSLKESKKNKKRISNKLIQEKIQKAKSNIEKFNMKDIKLRIPVETIKIDEKRYFQVNNEFVPLEKLIKFLDMLEMTDYMKWTAYNIQKNKEDHTLPLLNKMKDLFFAIVIDSQIKI